MWVTDEITSYTTIFQQVLVATPLRFYLCCLSNLFLSIKILLYCVLTCIGYCNLTGPHSWIKSSQATQMTYHALFIKKQKFVANKIEHIISTQGLKTVTQLNFLQLIKATVTVHGPYSVGKQHQLASSVFQRRV